MLVFRFIDKYIRKFSHFRKVSRSYGVSYKISKKSRKIDKKSHRYFILRICLRDFLTFVRKVVATGFLTKSVRKVVKYVRKAVGTSFLGIVKVIFLMKNVGTSIF